MKIQYFDNEELMSKTAARLIFDDLKRKSGLLLCTASGSSPKGAYHYLVENYKLEPEVFEALRVLKLDEWGGIPMDNPQTCETYLQENLVKPLHISPSRYISFNSNPENPDEECRRIATCLESEGPIDICVLGLGLNGHIAFNEPDQYLLPSCHVARLSEKSLEHPMAKKMGDIPMFGLTIGMKDILQARKVIILVTGQKKNEIIRMFLSGKISTTLPASFLWLHPDVHCLINRHSIK